MVGECCNLITLSVSDPVMLVLITLLMLVLMLGMMVVPSGEHHPRHRQVGLLHQAGGQQVQGEGKEKIQNKLVSPLS